MGSPFFKQISPKIHEKSVNTRQIATLIEVFVTKPYFNTFRLPKTGLPHR
jgi:hypothetical protein